MLAIFSNRCVRIFLYFRFYSAFGFAFTFAEFISIYTIYILYGVPLVGRSITVLK